MFPPERPFDRHAGPQGAPYDHRLQQQARAMIPPAQMHAVQWNIVERMVQIGWPHAQRVKRKADTGGLTQSRDMQSRSPRYFRHAGQRDDVSGVGHPIWRDGYEAAWPGQMGHARDQIK